MLRISLYWVAAAASVFSCFLPLLPNGQPLTALQGAAFMLGAVLFAVACGSDLQDHWRRLQKKYKSDAEIKNYMLHWISRGGRAVVFTRDHTWANDRKIQALLFDKARLKELTICLPSDTELTRKLQEAGAEIITYPELGLTPGSRFTIINDGQNAAAAVAIGKTVDGVHVIEEFPIGDPVFAVTKDLVEILRRIQK